MEFLHALHTQQLEGGYGVYARTCMPVHEHRHEMKSSYLTLNSGCNWKGSGNFIVEEVGVEEWTLGVAVGSVGSSSGQLLTNPCTADVNLI